MVHEASTSHSATRRSNMNAARASLPRGSGSSNSAAITFQKRFCGCA